MSIIARNQRIIPASSPQFGRRKTWPKQCSELWLKKKHIAGQREICCRLVDFAALGYLNIWVSMGCGIQHLCRTGMPKGFDAHAPAHQNGQLNCQKFSKQTKTNK